MIQVHGDVPVGEPARVERETATWTGLSDVLGWGVGCEPARGPEDVVAQDEYSHDVVMRWAHAIYVVVEVT